MDYETVCRVQAASALGGGAILLVLPDPLLAVFGMGTGPDTVIVARMLGGVLFALGATLLGARLVTDRDARTRVAVGNAVCDGCITMFLAAAAATGAIAPLGWALTALFAANTFSWVLARRDAKDRATA